MKTRYSKKDKTFYPYSEDYKELPDDIIEVPLEAYHAAMARPSGSSFDFVNGELIITTPPEKTLDDIKGELSALIDFTVAAVYARWTRFESEYKEREAAAVAFKAAGYAGDPGIWVSAFASAAGKTNQEAADLIISQANNLRDALALLGAQRMRKYEILAAGDEAQARAAHADIGAQITAIAQAIR